MKNIIQLTLLLFTFSLTAKTINDDLSIPEFNQNTTNKSVWIKSEDHTSRHMFFKSKK